VQIRARWLIGRFAAPATLPTEPAPTALSPPNGPARRPAAPPPRSLLTDTGPWLLWLAASRPGFITPPSPAQHTTTRWDRRPWEQWSPGTHPHAAGGGLAPWVCCPPAPRHHAQRCIQPRRLCRRGGGAAGGRGGGGGRRQGGGARSRRRRKHTHNRPLAPVPSPSHPPSHVRRRPTAACPPAGALDHHGDPHPQAHPHAPTPPRGPVRRDASGMQPRGA
jgi:hypothetical protein